MMNFLFEFSGGSSFKFQDVSTVLSTKKHLEIIFPNGNVLTINSNTTAQEYPNNASGFSGQFTSPVLATFFETSINNFIKIDTKQLREDIAIYPEYFKTPEGNNAEFNYEYFPSGVYKVTYTISISTPAPSPSPSPILGLVGNSIPETKTIYVKMDQSANICLKRKIEWLFENKLEKNTSQEEYDLVKDQVMQILMMMHIANFDYENNAYQEANLKLASCDNICATGNLGYLYDSTRP